jgi:hypothetical protein
MECPSCAAKVSEGSRFCSNCGAALSVHCQECAHNNAAGSKFCANCGTRLTTSNQAKPAEVVNPLPAVDCRFQFIAATYYDLIAARLPI